jgi:hypothetical protein
MVHVSTKQTNIAMRCPPTGRAPAAIRKKKLFTVLSLTGCKLSLPPYPPACQIFFVSSPNGRVGGMPSSGVPMFFFFASLGFPCWRKRWDRNGLVCSVSITPEPEEEETTSYPHHDTHRLHPPVHKHTTEHTSNQ